MRKVLTYILLVLVSLCPFGAIAQPDSVSLQGVEVTGVAPCREGMASTPVQAFTQERLHALGIGTMTEALRHIAGITVRDYGGAGGMKTVSVRGIGARHTGVVYDGLAVGDCQTGETDLSRFTVDNMSRLAMVVGDGDDIFVPARQAAAPASLHIVTTPDSAGWQARVSAGSWATLSPSLRVALPVGKAMVDVSCNYQHSDNNYPFELRNVTLVTKEHRRNSKMDAGRAEAGMRWMPAPQTVLTARAYYYDNDRQLPGIVRLYTQDNDEQLRERNAFVQSSLRTALADWLLWQANAKFSWAASAYRIGQPSGGITSQSYWQREYYASTALLLSPFRAEAWRNLTIDYSADVSQNNLNCTLDKWGHPQRITFLQSLSAKYSSGRITAIARGLWTNCWDRENGGEGSSRHEQRLSPSVSMSVRVLDNNRLMLRAFWKNTFRMPTFNELYYYHIGTDNLLPETTSQWNIGAVTEHSFGTGVGSLALMASADAYVAKVEDKIVAIPFNMFVWRMMNLAKVRTSGVDITTNMAWQAARRHRLTLSANYSFQRAQNRSNPSSPNYGNQIVYTPQNTFAVTAGWENPWADVIVTVDGMDERWTTNEHSNGTRMDGFAEMDITLRRSFSLWGARAVADAAVLNLTDRQYDIVAHYPMPGRSFRITLTLTNNK